MAKKKDYLDQLAAAAEDLNEVLGLEPPIETDGVTKSNLESKITEAAGLLAEEDEITKGTRAIIDSLTEQKEPEEEEEEETAKAEKMEGPTLEEVIQSSKRGQLKKLIKSEPEFESLRDRLDEFRGASSMRKAMLKILKFARYFEISFGDPKEAVAEEAPKAHASKPEKPKAANKAPTKEKTNKQKRPGVIASIVEAIENAGEKGISKESILKILVKKFPDRQEKSMKNTINIQVPNRISKERFKVERLKNGNYRKQ